MHRLHHEHSDTPLDPALAGERRHPRDRDGAVAQLQARASCGLLQATKPEFTRYARGPRLPPQCAEPQPGCWYLPYLLHAAVALALGSRRGMAARAGVLLRDDEPPGAGRRSSTRSATPWGGRNFDTPDNSRNNHFAAWLILGEGFQNNHHRYPRLGLVLVPAPRDRSRLCRVRASWRSWGSPRSTARYLIPAPPRLREAAGAGARA